MVSAIPKTLNGPKPTTSCCVKEVCFGKGMESSKLWELPLIRDLGLQEQHKDFVSLVQDLAQQPSSSGRGSRGDSRHRPRQAASIFPGLQACHVGQALLSFGEATGVDRL